MSDPTERNVEQELWKVFDRLEGEALDVESLRLKAIELVVKIRSAGPKVKPDRQVGSDRSLVEAARRKPQA